MTQFATHLSAVEREPTFLAIGSFDGVHRGHQALLQTLVTSARANDARAAVLTFFPHPSRVVHGISGRHYLMTLADRQTHLAASGVDLIITRRFDEETRQTRAADFVAHLHRHLDLKGLVGGNFALGYGREGDVPFLRRLGEEMGFVVKIVDQMVHHEGERVSSTRIRQALQAGAIDEVNACLGRPFTVQGAVVKGAQRGRQIGFPTANIAVWDELLLPGHGVYATEAWVDGRRHPAATNIGVRPTVGGENVTVEAHLIDYAGDLYGRELRLDFIARMRPERKFDGLPALQAQIDNDVRAIRQLLAERHPT